MSSRNSRGKKRLIISTHCMVVATYGGGNVLDVGVSSNQQIPFTNFFLNTFQPPDGCYTGLGIEDLTRIAALHHDKSFVRYAGGVFPFKDKAFE